MISEECIAMRKEEGQGQREMMERINCCMEAKRVPREDTDTCIITCLDLDSPP